MKVKITAHKHWLIIETQGPDPEVTVPEIWYPIDASRFGCVLCDTEMHLGLSQEALDLLAKIPKGSDSIGDVDWWTCDDGTRAFAWCGPVNRVMDTTRPGFETSRDFKISDDYILIPNEIPAGALVALEEPG